MTIRVWLMAYRREDGVLADATELTPHGLDRVAAIFEGYFEEDLVHAFGLDERELAALAELAGVTVDTDQYIYLMQGTADGGQPKPATRELLIATEEDDDDDDEPDPSRIPADMGVQLIWFDRSDDRCVDAADITSLGRERIAEIVGIPFGYLLYSNPVENGALSTLADLAGMTVDPERYRYFVEGFANSR